VKFDVVGQINNMRLPDGKAAILYSVYEAVSNSVHAIEDRFSEEKASQLGTIESANQRSTGTEKTPSLSMC
jgi:hypothetical protein